jgi:hypothetical protein
MQFLRRYGPTLSTGLMGAGMAYHPALHTHGHAHTHGPGRPLTLAAAVEARDLFDNTPLLLAVELAAGTTSSLQTTLTVDPPLTS